MDGEQNEFNEVNKAEDDNKVVHSEVAIDVVNYAQNNMRHNPGIKAEAVSIPLLESNKNQNDKSHTDSAKATSKKELSNSSSITNYLKSEFIGVNTQDINVQQKEVKLPKYTEINMISGYSTKNNKKNSKRMNYNKNRSLYGKGRTIIVQFMGSEQCSEDKELIEYEPETGNKLVKGILLVLLLLHSSTFFFTFILFLAGPTRSVFLRYGFFISIIPYFVVLGLIIFAAFTKHVRTSFGANIIMAWVVFLLSLAYASSAGDLTFESGIFLYSYLTLAFTDMLLLIMVAIKKNFDFTSRSLYGIALCFGLLTFTVIVYLADNHVFEGQRLFENLHREQYLTYYLAAGYTIILLLMSIAELRFFLAGEWIEVGEDDYSFGAFLMYVAVIDYPIRMLRKKGAFDRCDTGEE